MARDLAREGRNRKRRRTPHLRRVPRAAPLPVCTGRTLSLFEDALFQHRPGSLNDQLFREPPSWVERPGSTGSLSDHSFRERLFCADMPSYPDSLNDYSFGELPSWPYKAVFPNCLNGQLFRESPYRADAVESRNLLNDLPFRNPGSSRLVPRAG